jgi:tRNA(Ile)-lysidine synthase
MWNKISDFIERNQLMHIERKQLVAVSGGADSVALLLILKRLGYNLDAVHCNFHLRGEESNRDETFVKELCKKNNVNVHLIHFDTNTYASLHHVSIEMAARELRYRYFEQLRQDIGAECICVAHHQNDTVETFLMNLVRGTGLHGLTGIKPRNGFVVRPMLEVSKHEIEDFLCSIEQTWIVDSTNLKDDVVRNKLRLNIIPQLESINPQVSTHILQTVQRLSEVERVLNQSVESARKRVIDEDGHILIDSLLAEPSPALLLYEILSPMGFSSASIEQVATHLDQCPGRIYSSPTHELAIDRQRIIIAEKHALPATLRIPEPGLYSYENRHVRVEVTDDSLISKQPSEATLDAQQVTFPLTIRPTRNGDRFIPYGMEGSRLVSDYLTDKKVNILEKRRQLVVTDKSEAIVWLVNHRTDNRFRIQPNITRQTLHISFD